MDRLCNFDFSLWLKGIAKLKYRCNCRCRGLDCRGRIVTRGDKGLLPLDRFPLESISGYRLIPTRLLNTYRYPTIDSSYTEYLDWWRPTIPTNSFPHSLPNPKHVRRLEYGRTIDLLDWLRLVRMVKCTHGDFLDSEVR